MDQLVPTGKPTTPQLPGVSALHQARKQFPLTLLEIRAIRKWLDSQSREAHLPPTQQGHVSLVASELLVNLLEHAEPPPSSVELQCRISRGRITVEIAALAHSFSGEEAFLAAKSTPEDFDSLAEGGMGLYFVAQFTSELHYIPAKGRNQPEKFIYSVELP